MSLITLSILLALLFALVLGTRYLPFLLPAGVAESRYAKRFERVFPPGIIAFLVLFTLKDVGLSTFPHALPEAAGVGAVIGVHLLFRNSLLSIFSGVAVQQLLIYLLGV